MNLVLLVRGRASEYVLSASLQVAKLASEHHIYMTSNGRISMAGVTTKNVERLAQAMHKVTTE